MNNDLTNIKDSAAGMTLVELLVAMVIGMVLLGGIYVYFIGSTTSYSMNERLSRMQENSRFASYLIKDAVAGAGFLGCQNRSGFTSVIANPTDLSVDYRRAIFGLEAVGGVWQRNGGGVVNPGAGLPAGLAATGALADSDILVVRHVMPGFEAALGAGSSTSSLNVSVGLGPFTDADDDGTPLLITDCEGSTLFRSAYNNGTGVLTPTVGLNREYPEGAQLYVPQTTTFYLRNRLNADGTVTPSLYRRVSTAGNIEELVEGVESMQITYGVDTDGDRSANIYVAANAAGINWDNVVSVRVGLLMRSADEVSRGDIDTNVYNVNGTNVNAPGNDRRIRTVVNFTIGVRNRIL